MNYQMFIYPVFLVAAFYFLLIRPQKKRESQINQMRNNLKIGDKIVTIGGVYGKIVKIKDDRITIEVEGSAKTLLTMAKWGISSLDQPVKSVPNKEKTEKADKSKIIEEEVESEEDSLPDSSDEVETDVNDIENESEEKE